MVPSFQRTPSVGLSRGVKDRQHMYESRDELQRWNTVARSTVSARLCVIASRRQSPQAVANSTHLRNYSDLPRAANETMNTTKSGYDLQLAANNASVARHRLIHLLDAIVPWPR